VVLAVFLQAVCKDDNNLLLSCDLESHAPDVLEGEGEREGRGRERK